MRVFHVRGLSETDAVREAQTKRHESCLVFLTGTVYSLVLCTLRVQKYSMSLAEALGSRFLTVSGVLCSATMKCGVYESPVLGRVMTT